MAGEIMRIKHPQLTKDEQGRYCFHCKSQTKERNTESLYLIHQNELYMAGVKIEEHPKFKNITHFENWCNTYWANN